MKFSIRNILLSALMFSLSIPCAAAEEIDYQGAPFAKLAELYKEKKYQQGMKAIESYLKQYSKDRGRKIGLYLSAGGFLYALGKKGLARKAFEQALNLDFNPSLPPFFNRQARSYFSKIRERFLKKLELFDLAPKTISSQTKPRAKGGLSGLSWLLFGISAAGFGGGIALIADAGSTEANYSSWLENGTKFGHSQQILENSAQSLRGSLGLQRALGWISIGLGAASLGGAVALIILQGSGKKK